MNSSQILSLVNTLMETTTLVKRIITGRKATCIIAACHTSLSLKKKNHNKNILQSIICKYMENLVRHRTTRDLPLRRGLGKKQTSGFKPSIGRCEVREAGKNGRRVWEAGKGRMKEGEMWVRRGRWERLGGGSNVRVRKRRVPGGTGRTKVMQ